MIKNIAYIRRYSDIKYILNMLNVDSTFFYRSPEISGYRVIITKHDDWSVSLIDSIFPAINIPLDIDDEIDEYRLNILRLALCDMIIKHGLYNFEQEEESHED